ncbi:MAG TPA: NAD(P)-dependent oxidoreductase [Roseiarcus sp.]|nr:NAD(P)-dependent oxidoreductase [Roseiarcus sp.]
MQRIALLGVGTMGAGMAANWLKKGFPLTMWNRTPARAAPFAAKGATIAATPREAAEGADIIVAMVADDDASRDVWLGPSGALENAKPGAILIESSTLTPDWVRELAGKAQERGCRFLDAPVGGSRTAAAAGQLVLFVGGDAGTLEAARPALEAAAQRVNHVGSTGAGATWKLINNMLTAIQAAGLAEALAFARKSGFAPDQISALIGASAAASPIVQAKLPRMIEGEFDETDFALYLMHKDTRYAVALAEKLGAPHDVIAAAEAAFARAEAKGLGAKDFAAVAT